MQNTAFYIGAIALIDKVNKNHNPFNYLFGSLNSKQKQFIETTDKINNISIET